MDSLANYASDEENSNNSEDTKVPCQSHGDANRRASDANYDPVQMDMSEESNNNNSSSESSSERANSPLTAHSAFNSRTGSSRTLSSPSDQRRTDHESHTTNAKEEHKRGDRSSDRSSDRTRHSSDKGRRSSYDDRRQRDSNHRDSRDLKRSRDDDRKSRDEDKKKEKSSSGSSRDEKNDDRDKNDRDHHHRDDRIVRKSASEWNDRDRRRDRERRQVRHRDEWCSYHKDFSSKDRARARSRSRSRDRASRPDRTTSYREAKRRNKLAQLEKLGIELKAPEGDATTQGGTQTEQNYYNPLATATQGKYAEQIQKRKLLWTSKIKIDESSGPSTAASTANTWVGTTFTHDVDGKLTAKFKRLMGIKDNLPTVPAEGAKPDILKKQEEMFNNMEQQYEVARATTHTQRGVGLGYATGGYQFSR